MPSQVFAIHLAMPDAKRIAEIGREFEHHFPLGDSLVLVRTEKIVSDVAKEAGVSSGDGEPVVGAVFKLNRVFAGYYQSDLRDWLDAE